MTPLGTRIAAIARRAAAGAFTLGLLAGTAWADIGGGSSGGGGGSTPPGGTNGQIQYNNAGSFGGLANSLTIAGQAVGLGGSLTAAVLTAALNQFSSSLQGLVPASGGGTTNYLRADGTWAAPAGGGSAPTLSAGSGAHTLSGTAAYFVCTGACTITLPTPAAAAEYCVYNDTGVSTAITLAALGGSDAYEKTDHSGYGTAGTGTMVSAGALGDRVCLTGRDATHYQIGALTGSWTVN
ncbi:MAG TPA: hypothetical protein VFA12_20265 [Stellaceae bacterium]|nr:hypothetical protein [Stellaceae bacterium]